MHILTFAEISGFYTAKFIPLDYSYMTIQKQTHIYYAYASQWLLGDYSGLSAGRSAGLFVFQTVTSHSFFLVRTPELKLRTFADQNLGIRHESH